eukprot:m.117402 g.117402  ORF g.117402 m.117402 type:complete len:61 (-) comp10942_c10_seq1:1112-1294(-)
MKLLSPGCESELARPWVAAGYMTCQQPRRCKKDSCNPTFTTTTTTTTKTTQLHMHHISIA